MNGTANRIVVLLFFVSTLILNSQVHWADKVISFTSQIGEIQYSANQALGQPSSYSNEKLPTSWMPKISTKEKYESISLGFENNTKSKYVIINMPMGSQSLEIVNIVNTDSQESSIYIEKNIIFNENGRIIIELPIPVTIQNIKLYFDVINSKSEVLLDAVGVGNDTSNIRTIDVADINLFTSSPENMGDRINSPYSELAPIISADGKKLFFTRDNHPENIGLEKKQDVWFSDLEEDGRFSKSRNLYEPVNNKNNNFAFSTNSDGTMLLMGRSNKSNELSSLSYFKYENKGWSELKTFQFIEIGNKTNFVNYSLSQSMNVMFISMERDDSYGGLDLYFSSLTDSGWSELKNLGPHINTAGDEIAPYISNDNKTLYFATNGRPGYGSMDLFVTKSEDGYNSWQSPKNLGDKINSKGWEAYFTISSVDDYAYFVSSNNSIGNEDIFRIKLPSNIRPDNSLIVKGQVTEYGTKKPIGSILEFRNLNNNKLVGITNSDSVNGNYQITIPQGSDYGVSAISDGYYSESKTIFVVSSNDSNLNLNLSLKPVQIGESYELVNIFFEFGKSRLDENSNSELLRLVKFLKRYENLNILILGYTDEIGSESNNMKLSESRAKSVYEFLIKNGISQDRLKYEGKGELKSNKNGKLEESRKVEFKIIRDSK
ncbi:MAG: OmpA family protein [Candidatus Kapaibacterium sp.]|nr:OmpA family protein [Ignavibacteriota bacterium]MCB9220982.1 OmpA family protein [Ignavibacteria bacterium]